MPTYEYICEKCGHSFDMFQSMSADAIEVCPKEQCAKPRWGKGKVKRAIGGGAGLIFKGSGFYITDYRSDSYKAAAKSDTNTASSAPATKSSGDSKPSSSSGSSTTPSAKSTKSTSNTSKS
ncbi:MAG: hypothetical protein RI897_456 [Verrucomicrobiota bacterium]|jgi:putative FmdB family regulatory protein